MKTKIFLFLFLSALVWSCTSEPEFPDPGFDKTRTTQDTVRRDTIDIYTLKMDISAPNGVKTMQVLNGRDYKLIEEVDRFNGQTEFTFEYDIDLTTIEKDTVMQFIVKVVDNSMRSYNKGFILNVRDFSKPVINVRGATEVMGLVSPVFELKATFETGMNHIDSYKVMLEGEAIDEQAITDTLMSVYQYKHIIKANMQKGESAVLSIQLKDSKGTVSTRNITLNLIEMKKPSRVTYSTASGLDSEFEMNYNEKGLLTRIFQTYYVSHLDPNGFPVTSMKFKEYVFNYDEKDLMTSWEEWYLDEKGEERTEAGADMYFYYDEQGRFAKSMPSDESSYSTIRVGEYYSDGRPKSFYKGTSTVALDNLHYTPEFDGSGYVFTEVLHGSNQSDKWRQHQVDMTAVPIPTYLPQLPAISRNLGKGWDDLFTRKYVCERGQYTYRTPEEYGIKYMYSTDVNGRLTQLRRVEGSGFYAKESVYVFSYDED